MALFFALVVLPVGILGETLEAGAGILGSRGVSCGVDDVRVQDVWSHLSSDTKATLIDVRTRAEWSFVGLPDLASLGKQVLMVEWQMYPDGRVNPDFGTHLRELLEAGGIGKDADLYFLCRSGARSRQAAEAMAAAGYARCHNVLEGFEGPLDSQRRRGLAAGWKAAGLPWAQT